MVQDAGLRLTVEEFSTFMQQTGQAGDAMLQLGQDAQSSAQQVSGAFTANVADTQSLHVALTKLSKEGYAAVDARAQELLRTQAGTLTANQAYAQALKETEASAVAASQSLQEAAASTSAAGDASKSAELGFIALGAAISAISAKATELVINTTLTAGRIKELEILLEVTRQNAVALAEAEGQMSRAAALNASAVQAQVQGIRDLHLSGLVANETVAQLIRYQLDWTKATELANLAQDAATFAAQDSSQALEGLIKGIATLQPRILRTYGIMVNLNEAYRVYAKENNLAATELSQNERQQAALNAVLAQAPRIMGAYEESLGAATKQIRSVQTDIVNLSEAYGSFLEPAVRDSVASFRGFLQALTDLPAPLRGLITGVTAGGTATIALTASAATAITVLVKLRTALSALSGVALTASQLLLGIGGVLTLGVSAAIAITAAVKEHERAENELQTQILASTDSYTDYVEKMKEAGFEQDILAEAIWNTVRAKEAEQKIDQARAYIEAREAVEDMVLAFGRLAPSGDQLRFIADGLEEIAANDKLAEVFATDAEYLDQLIHSGKTFAGSAVDDAQKIVGAWTLVAKALQTGATLAEQEEAITFIEQLKEGMDLTGKDGVQLEIILNAVISAIRGMGPAVVSTYDDIIEKTEELNEAFGHMLTMEYYRDRTERHRKFMEDIVSETDKGTQALIDAGVKRNRAFEDLDIEYQQKAQDAWIEYQRAITASEEDWAAYHAGTLQELLDLDREYLQDRNDAWTKYQQDLEDLDRELQRDIEDANRDRAEKLLDLEREYGQDLEDARRELAQDMEDLEREHQDRLEDIRTERQESLLELEEEYQRRLWEIENAGLLALQKLRDDYAEKDSDARLAAARRALELLEQQNIQISDEMRQAIIDMFRTGAGPEDLLDLLPQDVALMFRDLLEELRGLNDDLFWDQLDLSDDIQKDQERRKEDLQKWLADEQAAIEEAYQKRLEEEQRRIEQERAEREREYADKLEDLRRSREREREEIERDHQRRLDDIRLQHERERQEAAQNYQRRLEDLLIAYEREKEAIRLKLEEQNEEARQKYKEALEDLTRAKERERDEINRQYARTKEDIARDVEEAVKTAADKYEFLPEALKPTHDKLKTDLHGLLVGDPNSLTNQWVDFLNNLQANILQARSPSQVFVRMGESIIDGLEQGMGGQTIGDLLTGNFNAQSVIGDLQAQMANVLPYQVASVPGGIGGSTINRTSNSTLNVTANYQHQGGGGLADDLSLWHMMMKARGRL